MFSWGSQRVRAHYHSLGGGKSPPFVSLPTQRGFVSLLSFSGGMKRSNRSSERKEPYHPPPKWRECFKLSVSRSRGSWRAAFLARFPCILPFLSASACFSLSLSFLPTKIPSMCRTAMGKGKGGCALRTLNCYLPGVVVPQKGVSLKDHPVHPGWREWARGKSKRRIPLVIQGEHLWRRYRWCESGA